jgi:hypothetical protein
MAMLETAEDGGDEGLEQLGFLDLLQEAERRAANVFVWMLL